MTLNEQPLQFSGDTAMAGAAEVIEFQTATLPILIERASRALLEARSSAEVLEARDMASVAYDAAKSAGRIAKAQKAHDEIISSIHRAQAEACLVEARAKMRLADEYGAAQERGEVAKNGGKRSRIPDQNSAPTVAEIGLNPKTLHEGRKLSDAEKASPGKTKAVLDSIVARGEEPTRTKMQREVVEPPTTSVKKSTSAVDPERRKLEKLTPDALIDEVLGLRADLADAKASVTKLTEERNNLKRQVSELSGKDGNAVIRELQIKLKNAESAKWREGEKTAAALKQVYALKQELKRVGATEIPL